MAKTHTNRDRQTDRQEGPKEGILNLFWGRGKRDLSWPFNEYPKKRLCSVLIFLKNQEFSSKNVFLQVYK